MANVDFFAIPSLLPYVCFEDLHLGRSTPSDLEETSTSTQPHLQEAFFNVKATIACVLGRKGWSYISCASCSRNLQKCGSSLRCNSPAVTGLPRYRVELNVSDGDATSTFMVFDTEMTKTASSLIQEAPHSVDGELPQCLKNLAGKHYNFQPRVTLYNFTPSHRTFTVTKITEMSSPAYVPHRNKSNAGTKEDMPASAQASNELGLLEASTANKREKQPSSKDAVNGKIRKCAQE